MSDLKMIAVGVGLEALFCATFAPDPWSHACGAVALVAAGMAVTFRHFETR